MNRLLASIPSVLLAVFCVACGDDADSSTVGTGGAGSPTGGSGTGSPGSGGSPGTGGATASGLGTGGGSTSGPGTGGATSSGLGTGGSPGTGGTPSTGGAVGTGGTPSTGGHAGTGGSLGTGGTPSTGGHAGTGGISATGGADLGGTGGGATGESSCVSGVATGSPCDPAVDTTECQRSDRTCTCDASGQWSCTPSTGSGGTSGVGTGGTTSTTGGTDGSGGAGVGGTNTGGENVGGDPSTGGNTAIVTEPEVITSSNGNWWQEVTPTKASGGNASVTVNPNNTHQTWIGFGGCFNEKGWVALSDLSAEERTRAIKLLFSKTEGAGFTLGRMPMGASDYALTRYTYDDSANDTSMSSFSIQKDEANLIPYIQAALEINPDLFIWGSPWTPPPWMKDNNAYDKGNMKSDQSILEAYALYFSKYISAYQAKGIRISAVAPQNEPGYPQDYPSCLWDSNTFTSFVKILGSKLQTDALDVDIWLGTMSNPDTDAGIINAVLGDGTAKGFIKGIGVQWGMMDQAASHVSKGVPLHQTEHRCGNYPFGYTPPAGSAGGDQSKAPNDFNYGLESWYYIRRFINDGGHSYSAWNMVLDSVGRSLDTVRPWAQNAPLIVEGGRLIETPAYYVFRHAAQFVDPGAVRIDTNASDGFAFQNPDGDIVLVMQTNSTQTITVGIGDTTLSFPGPGQGWVTVNYRPE